VRHYPDRNDLSFVNIYVLILLLAGFVPVFPLTTSLKGQNAGIDKQILLPSQPHLDFSGKQQVKQNVLESADETSAIEPSDSQSVADSRRLLSRLNLDGPGLERVKAEAAENPETAMKELLSYFRNGGSGKHPTDKNTKHSLLGKCASQRDIEIADNALKHIFVGQPSYPPHFCGEDIDWSTSPVPDSEWVWQLNRMTFWIAMGRAYWHTGDEKYAEAWADQLRDWVRKVPNDKAHHYAWRSIEAGIRGYLWTELFQRFVDSPAFTPDVMTAFLNSCCDHASFLMTRYSSRSNWSLIEAEGMAFIAIIFPQFKDADAWKTEAIRRLNAETTVQVYPDGHQRELSLAYHSECISWFLRTYELAQLNRIADVFPDAYLRTVEKMCEVVMKISLPDGTHVPFGDDWQGMPGQHKQHFLKWAELFGRDDFLYMATDGAKGVPPAQTAYALPESGIYSMRSGWNKDAICLVLKCGHDGGFHSQPDNGTFDMYAGGRNLMPDGGCYIYTGDQKNRNWFRQTKVHKTLTLNDRNSRYAPKLLLWSPGERQDILVVENDSYENLTHRRAVFFIDKSYFVIVDEAIGTAAGQVGIHFQLAPGKMIVNEKNFSARSDFKDSWNVMIRTVSQKGLRLKEEEGQVSFRYTEKEPRPAFVYQMDKPETGGVRFVTVVAPYAGTGTPDIKVELPEEPVGNPSVRLKIKNGKQILSTGYSLK
jgi:heparan-sulfate lyase